MILQEVAQEEIKLRAFLQKSWRFSGRLIKELASEKKVFVSGKSRRMDYSLKPGEKVLVDLGWEKNTYPPFERALNILYEDEAMLVISKDPYYSVHPVGAHQKDTLLNAVSHYELQSGQDFKIRFAHRLDRDTSGVVIIAKNKWVQELLAEQFREGKVKKEYLALVHGSPPETFTVTGRIGLAEDGIHREFRHDGKDSKTAFETLRKLRDISLVRARPQTGRTHQLRVHLASKGHPIVGDSLYGTEDAAARQMLHASRLSLSHPVTREPLHLEAPLPEDFQQEMENSP